MSRQYITPLKDASLYQQYPTRNAGLDEILEIGKTRVMSGSVRAVIQFDTSKFTAPISASYFLNLRIATAGNLLSDQSIEVHELTQSWDEGTGFFEQDLENAKDGATWITKDNADVTWSLAGGSTGSLVGSVAFGFEPRDIRLDISDIVRSWITGSVTNNGLMVKMPIVNELNTRSSANIKFFSKNTHTIYPPTIEAVWNTQTMSVPSTCVLEEAPEEIELFIWNARNALVTGSTARIRIGIRNAQPIKTFGDSFRYSNKFYLSSGSFLGIQDAATKAYVVPFDSGSLISADATSSFFDLKIENMYIGRTYTILVQRNLSDNRQEIIDTGHSFKVV